jgi:hypothetical protein
MGKHSEPPTAVRGATPRAVSAAPRHRVFLSIPQKTPPGRQ